MRPHLVLPEVTTPACWTLASVFVDPEQQKLMRSLNRKPSLLVVNRDFVDPSRIRRATDILQPEYKGQITGDEPTVGGQGKNTASCLYVLMSEEFVRKLYGE